MNERLLRRYAFCAQFVCEHHPGMADDAYPLMPFAEPNYGRDGNGNMRADWWLQTDDCMSALGFVWLAHLFDRHGLYDHAWMIGRNDQEPWALVSEPYAPPAEADVIAALRHDLKQVGTELLEYPPGQSTHCPGGTLPLVANVVDHYRLLGKVARRVADHCAAARPLRRLTTPGLQ